MPERRRDNSRGRNIQEQESMEHSEYRAPAQGRRHREKSPFRKLIPILFLGGIGLLIAHEEIPAFAQWWEKSFSPDRWHAKKACQEMAVRNASRPAYVRIINAGKVHRTEKGLYVDGMRLGEMASDGNEQKVEYSCYLDSAGVVVQLNRLQ